MLNNIKMLTTIIIVINKNDILVYVQTICKFGLKNFRTT